MSIVRQYFVVQYSSKLDFLENGSFNEKNFRSFSFKYFKFVAEHPVQYEYNIYDVRTA